MDLLFKRYASPFSILEGYIGTGRFCEFIDNFVKTKHEDDIYEIWLHKVFDETYKDFREKLTTAEEIRPMTKKDMETTVQQSVTVLSSFNPNLIEKGVVTDDII